jgi:hypothetical protein
VLFVFFFFLLTLAQEGSRTTPKPNGDGFDHPQGLWGSSATPKIEPPPIYIYIYIYIFF